jgi:nucleoside-diphosphate-sugar epimerase
MNDAKTILITGASGNLGSKLRQHLQGRYPLRLLDLKPNDDEAIHQADLGVWDEAWTSLFRGVDTVVHLAANPSSHQSWADVVGPNIDAVVNVLTAAVQTGVRRVVYASSNHAMGGYKDISQPEKLTTDIPALPGTHYTVTGKSYDSTPYGSAKLMGERIGKCYADIYGLSFIAVRIGWVRRGQNYPGDIPPEWEDWFHLMWLSNRDYCHLMERCIEADPSIRFAVVNGMSANTGMRWDIEFAHSLLGYEPLDDVTR